MARKNQSPYGGGFVKGKNTSEYNHNYYVKNKHRWKNKKHKKKKNPVDRILQEQGELFMSELKNVTKSFDPVIRFIRNFMDVDLMKIARNLWGAIKEIDLAKEVDTKAIKKSFDNAEDALKTGRGEVERLLNEANRTIRQKRR
jgi:predicted nucleotide-binding protein (sugar kinase/HSP70/actin superfamily)